MIEEKTAVNLAFCHAPNVVELTARKEIQSPFLYLPAGYLLKFTNISTASRSRGILVLTAFKLITDVVKIVVTIVQHVHDIITGIFFGKI